MISDIRIWPWILFVARIAAGGVLILASLTKLGVLGGAQNLERAPLVFALTIESFKLIPKSLIPAIAYFVPWCEFIAGVALVMGIWSRQSALVATALLAVFTLALASVLTRHMNVDCGCFGGLFGESKVTTMSLLRNSIFIVCAAAVAIFGGGALCVTAERSAEAPSAA